MDYNLAYIRDRILEDKLDDPTFDPGIVDRFINDAQRSLFNSYELPFAEKVFAGVLSASQYIFEFPDDYGTAQSFMLVSDVLADGSRVKRNISNNYIDFRDFNERFPAPEYNESGAPSTWTLHGNKIYFDRPLDMGYTMKMFYLKRPAKLVADTDVPEVPEDFQEVLILGAHYRILQRNEDFDLAAAVKQEYYDEADKLVPRLGTRQKGTPMIMGQPRRAPVRRRR